MHPDSHRFESHNSLIIQRRSERKKKKISTLLRYWFSFDGSWLASCYLVRGFVGFFCQGNTKFRVFLLFLTQTNKLPTHYSSLPTDAPLDWPWNRNWKSRTKRLELIESLWRSNVLNQLLTLFTTIFFSFIVFNFFLLLHEKIISWNWNIRRVSNGS